MAACLTAVQTFPNRSTLPLEEHGRTGKSACATATAKATCGTATLSCSGFRLALERQERTGKSACAT
jgi:hypothetical protein